MVDDRPVVVDLFSGPGGASAGYALAGFRVIGVDVKRYPRYMHEFVQGDALTVGVDLIGRIEPNLIHASPPCQHRSRATAWRGNRDDHPDLLVPTLAVLEGIGLPYVVENVPEAVWDGTMRQDYLLCGTMFGLAVRRHRAFQVAGFPPMTDSLPACNCYRNPAVLTFGHKGERAYADAMGCHFMSKVDAREAIPPAYTRHIATDALNVLRCQRPATTTGPYQRR